jgi:isopentenyldiphosphate isomerase
MRNGSLNDERYDIFDINRNPIGTATRAEVHAQGLWHQTFHCWVWRRETSGISLLFQLRHPLKDTFPGLLDISCAGHLLALETPQHGVRELEEELGLRVPFAELLPCGVYKQQHHHADRLIDREFCHVFLLKHDQPLSSYRMQTDEVSGLFRIRLDDLKRLLREGTPAEAEGIVLGADGTISNTVRSVLQTDLVPHPIDYFQLIFNVLQQTTNI